MPGWKMRLNATAPGKPRFSGGIGWFFLTRDLCITLILAKIWKLTIDFIVKNMMRLANMELCRGL